MTSWTMTTYEQDERGAWHAVKYVKDDATTAKHGAFTWPLEGGNYFTGGNIAVKIYDNTKNGLNDVEYLEIAREVAQTPIFWSDDRLCHWFYDFKCSGHWIEGLFHNNGLADSENEFSPLHVNVFD